MVGHDDEGVQTVVLSIVLQRLKQQRGIPLHLKKRALARAVSVMKYVPKLWTRRVGFIASAAEAAPQAAV